MFETIFHMPIGEAIIIFIGVLCTYILAYRAGYQAAQKESEEITKYLILTKKIDDIWSNEDE